MSHYVPLRKGTPVAATLCEHDGELSNLEIAAQRVGCFDEALRLIAETTAPAMRIVQ